MKGWFATGLLLTCGLAHAADPLVFSASAKVEIDASGKVTSVEPIGQLSPALQDLVRRHLAGYRFEAPQRDGAAVAGTTYVKLGGCAVPDGKEYNVSLAFQTNGPRMEGVDFIAPPKYPPAGYQNGVEAEAIVTYVVEADGSATLEGIAYPKAQRQKQAFDKVLREWVGQMRYLPERIAGQPVRTRMEVPVDFKLSEGPSRKQVQREFRARPECVAAEATPGLLPVAVDSPFKRLPPQG